ncbi:neuroglian-like [Diabrotica virgifera virgifera]|uniref:Ig-like domain-containing protein n=1 Tax=Diabrotica virgifera virgifera TaxID=50390 RepID=A0ABM5L9B5_DIAVI|nr:neuroglian-like [Diabrotica virgifera virgifera]
MLCLIATSIWGRRLDSESPIRVSPPLIVKGPPNDELLFEVPEDKDEYRPVILNCEAEGFPAPRYSWLKNGKPFYYQTYDDRILMQPGRGILGIVKPVNEDSGQYQCFAENEYGIATSNSVFLRREKLDSFKISAPTTVVGNEGEPFKISCNPPGGYPKPKISWVYFLIQVPLKLLIQKEICGLLT